MPIEYDQVMVRFLIDALLLGKPGVFPDPPGEPLTGLKKALYEHAIVGRPASAETREFMTSLPEGEAAAVAERPSWWKRLSRRFRAERTR